MLRLCDPRGSPKLPDSTSEPGGPWPFLAQSFIEGQREATLYIRVVGSLGVYPTTSVIQVGIPSLYEGLVFGAGPFLLYHRSGFHFPQPCSTWLPQKHERRRSAEGQATRLRAPARRDEARQPMKLRAGEAIRLDAVSGVCSLSITKVEMAKQLQ